ncbi:hypothetical protein CLOP_g7622 [Closterium sp. NIES-67]|nr:hypothetical protein CLOP_g7622 [Closterium sp. NIES-67]
MAPPAASSGPVGTVRFKYATEQQVQQWRTSPDLIATAAVDSPLRFIYELCWTVVHGDLPPSRIPAALQSAGLSLPPSTSPDAAAAADAADGPAADQRAADQQQSPPAPDVPSLLADTVAQLAFEVSGQTELRRRLVELTKWLASNGVVTPRMFQDRCEAKLLWEAELIKMEPSELKKKCVRVNTRLVYTQTKFNLLREDSEGYAKLITILSQKGPLGLNSRSANAVVDAVKSLIGLFDLDPNRVFDIVLDCYEMQPTNTAFLHLVKLFPEAHAPQILGFKFSYYHRLMAAAAAGTKGGKGGGGSGSEGRIPDSLFVLAANCIKTHVVELAALYPFLDPPDEEAEERSKELNAQRIADVNRIGKINLAATGRDLTDDPQPADVSIDLYGAVDAEESAAAKGWGEAESNDKMRLLKALLLVDDWPHARQLLEHLKPLHPVAHPPICAALCSLISRAIAPAYNTVHPSYLLKGKAPAADTTALPNLPTSPASDADVEMAEAGFADGAARGRRKGERVREEERDGEVEGEKDRGGVGRGEVESRGGGLRLPGRVFEMLRYLGAFLYQDTILLQKLCKVLKADLLQARSAAAVAVTSAASAGSSAPAVSVAAVAANASAPAALCNGPSLSAPTAAAATTANGPIPSESNDASIAVPDASASTAAATAAAVATAAAAAAKEVEGRVIEALEVALLPALQAVVANPPVCMQLWELLSCIPFHERYRLYGEWERDNESNPLVLAARQIARLDTRRTLKRLAKENLKPTGRLLAKLAHSNPITVLRTIVVQVEAYKEMIPPVVDAFKYFNQLEFDMLEYVVIERLALPRSTIKDDGLNIADWLQCLATFWGSVCKKYPLLELRGLLSYVVNRLHGGEAVELVLLQELMEQMAGIETSENLTEEQLEALAGGDTLRQLTASFGQAKNNKALARSMGRLKDALLPVKGEANLAVPLLVLIARQRSNIVFEAEGSHIKLLSEHLDRCHLILLQYAQFLTAALSPPTAYAAFMPTLHALSQRFHVPPEAAFLFYRPVLRLFKPSADSPVAWPALAAADGAAGGGGGGGGGRGGEKGKRQQQQVGRKGQGEGVVMDGVVEEGVEEERQQQEEEEDLVLCLGDAAGSAGSVAAAASAGVGGADTADRPVHWRDVVEWVQGMPPAAAWRGLSPPFYLLFWGLTLSDLHVPRQRYEAEMAKQRALLRTLEDVGDSSGSAIQKRKKEKERVQEVLDKLSSELARQQARAEAVQRRLVRDRTRWLSPGAVPDSWRIVPCFLHHCVIPRALMSPEDAVYCAKFILRLHAAATPQFCTFQIIDAFVCKSFHPLLASSSEAEAGRLGRFVLEILQAIYRWKADAAVYSAECLNHPGSSKSVMKKPNNNMTLDQFRTINWKWNAKLIKVLSTLLESTEYMHIRNALTLLSRVAAVFPVTKRGGLVIERKVNRLKTEERQDLKLMATSVSAALNAKKQSWVTDEEFGGAPAPSATPRAASPAPLAVSPAAATATTTAAVAPAATVTPSAAAAGRTAEVGAASAAPAAAAPAAVAGGGGVGAGGIGKAAVSAAAGSAGAAGVPAAAAPSAPSSRHPTPPPSRRSSMPPPSPERLASKSPLIHGGMGGGEGMRGERREGLGGGKREAGEEREGEKERERDVKVKGEEGGFRGPVASAPAAAAAGAGAASRAAVAEVAIKEEPLTRTVGLTHERREEQWEEGEQPPPAKHRKVDGGVEGERGGRGGAGVSERGGGVGGGGGKAGSKLSPDAAPFVPAAHRGGMGGAEGERVREREIEMKGGRRDEEVREGREKERERRGSGGSGRHEERAGRGRGEEEERGSDEGKGKGGKLGFGGEGAGGRESLGVGGSGKWGFEEREEHEAGEVRGEGRGGHKGRESDGAEKGGGRDVVERGKRGEREDGERYVSGGRDERSEKTEKVEVKGREREREREREERDDDQLRGSGFEKERDVEAGRGREREGRERDRVKERERDDKGRDRGRGEREKDREAEREEKEGRERDKGRERNHEEEREREKVKLRERAVEEKEEKEKEERMREERERLRARLEEDKLEREREREKEREREREREMGKEKGRERSKAAAVAAVAAAAAATAGRIAGGGVGGGEGSGERGPSGVSPARAAGGAGGGGGGVGASGVKSPKDVEAVEEGGRGRGGKRSVSSSEDGGGGAVVGGGERGVKRARKSDGDAERERGREERGREKERERERDREERGREKERERERERGEETPRSYEREGRGEGRGGERSSGGRGGDKGEWSERGSVERGRGRDMEDTGFGVEGRGDVHEWGERGGGTGVREKGGSDRKGDREREKEREREKGRERERGQVDSTPEREVKEERVGGREREAEHLKEREREREREHERSTVKDRLGERGRGGRERGERGERVGGKEELGTEQDRAYEKDRGEKERGERERSEKERGILPERSIERGGGFRVVVRDVGEEGREEGHALRQGAGQGLRHSLVVGVTVPAPAGGLIHEPRDRDRDWEREHDWDRDERDRDRDRDRDRERERDHLHDRESYRERDRSPRESKFSSAPPPRELQGMSAMPPQPPALASQLVPPGSAAALPAKRRKIKRDQSLMQPHGDAMHAPGRAGSPVAAIAAGGPSAMPMPLAPPFHSGGVHPSSRAPPVVMASGSGHRGGPLLHVTSTLDDRGDRRWLADAGGSGGGGGSRRIAEVELPPSRGAGPARSSRLAGRLGEQDGGVGGSYDRSGPGQGGGVRDEAWDDDKARRDGRMSNRRHR